MVIDHKSLQLNGRMVFEKAILSTPFTRPIPMPDEACFLFVKKGKVHSYSATNFEIVQASETLLMKCGSYLAKMVSDEPEATYEAIAVHFSPEILNRVYENDLPEFLKNPPKSPIERNSVKIPGDILFQKFFDGMMFYFTNPELVNDELIILKVKEILLLLNNTKASAEFHQILGSLFSPTQYHFKRIIETHLFENLSLEDLATISGQSLSSFKRTFQEIFQDSPAKYIREKRLEKATELLRNHHLNISEIAFKCAFNDLGHFSKCFRAKYNCSPSEYREVHLT